MTGLGPYGTYSQKDEILQLSIINEEGDVLFNEYFKPQNKTKWKETEEIRKECLDCKCRTENAEGYPYCDYFDDWIRDCPICPKW